MDVFQCIENARELIGIRMRNELSIKAPYDTGNLSAKIRYDVDGEKITFSMPEYAMYLEYGTGLYNTYPGATKEKITAKNGKALAWGKTIGTSKSGKPMKQMVRKSIKGMTPQPFIRPAFHQKLLDIVTESLVECLKEIDL